MDFWIFGWTILRNPRLHRLDLNPSIQVERWIVVFLFPFFGRISALKKKNKPRMIATQLWLEGTGIMHFICVFPWFFHHFILHWYVYIICLSPLGPTKCRAWGGLWPYIYIYIYMIIYIYVQVHNMWTFPKLFLSRYSFSKPPPKRGLSISCDSRQRTWKSRSTRVLPLACEQWPVDRWGF